MFALRTLLHRLFRVVRVHISREHYKSIGKFIPWRLRSICVLHVRLSKIVKLLHYCVFSSENQNLP